MRHYSNYKSRVWIQLLLVLLCLCTVFPLASCHGGDSSGGSGTAQQETNDPNADLYDANGYRRDELPSNLNYQNEEFKILYWTETPTYEFLVEETNKDSIAGAIYTRNSSIQERLSVTLRFIGKDGDNKNQSAFLKHLDSTVGQSTQTYDLVASYTMCGGAMMIRGYGINLNDTKYFNSEMPWWPDNLTEEATVNDKLYFASGDISTNLLWSMFFVMYNKDLMASQGLDEKYNLYELASNGDWTLDVMMELAQDIYVDKDGDGEKSKGDLFGFTTSSIYGDSFFFGSELRTTERDDNGDLILSPTWGSEKTQALLQKLTDFFATDDAWMSYGDNSWSTSPNFAQGLVLIDLRPAYYLYQVVNAEGSNYDIRFGILPVPKYSSTQQKYYTTVGFTYSLYSIPRDVTDKDRASAVLEALGSAAYRQTTPVVFETTMKLRYSKDEESGVMYDLIRDSVSFDLGRLLCSSFGLGDYKNATYRIFRTALGEGDTNWISTYKGEEKALQSALNSIKTAMDKLKT